MSEQRRATAENRVVTHVIPYMHPNSGGPAVVVDRLCRQLPDFAWQPRVVTTDVTAPRGADDSWADQYRDGYPVDVFPAGGPGSFAYSSALRGAIGQIVAHSAIVHIHTAWTYPSWVTIRACRRQGVPFVVMPHGMLDPHSLQRKWLKKQLYGRAIEWPNLRSAAAMLYTHREEQRLAESSVSGLPTGHIVTLGADAPPDVPRAELAEEFLATRPELPSRRRVVFLSRLHSKKGLDLLIPAFAHVVQQQPDAHLLLVGQGEESYVAQLRQWVADNGLNERVTFTGPLHGRAKWAALAAGDVFALPSYQENFALVLTEALRSGLPVVISNRINIWQEVVGAGAGLECELAPRSIADAILKLLADEALCRRAAAAGLQLANETFTWQRSALALNDVYEQVLGTRGRGARPKPSEYSVAHS